jgi:hypothetical protein
VVKNDLIRELVPLISTRPEAGIRETRLQRGGWQGGVDDDDGDGGGGDGGGGGGGECGGGGGGDDGDDDDEDDDGADPRCRPPPSGKHVLPFEIWLPESLASTVSKAPAAKPYLQVSANSAAHRYRGSILVSRTGFNLGRMVALPLWGVRAAACLYPPRIIR